MLFYQMINGIFNKQSKKIKMSTIHVLTDKLNGGYQPIIDFYNKNKPSKWTVLRKACACEGGFECDLPEKEIEKIKKNRLLCDKEQHCPTSALEHG